MNNFPILSGDQTGTSDLRWRINLDNRPKLTVDYDNLNRVALQLAQNGRERAQFVEDPVGYLQLQSIPVHGGQLHTAMVAQTSELCTAIAGCNAAANVNVVVNVNFLINALAVWNAAAVTVAVAANFVKVENYGGILNKPSSPWLDGSLNSEFV
jgi:hypothetical protein